MPHLLHFTDTSEHAYHAVIAKILARIEKAGLLDGEYAEHNYQMVIHHPDPWGVLDMLDMLDRLHCLGKDAAQATFNKVISPTQSNDFTHAMEICQALLVHKQGRLARGGSVSRRMHRPGDVTVDAIIALIRILRRLNMLSGKLEKRNLDVLFRHAGFFMTLPVMKRWYFVSGNKLKQANLQAMVTLCDNAGSPEEVIANLTDYMDDELLNNKALSEDDRDALLNAGCMQFVLFVITEEAMGYLSKTSLNAISSAALWDAIKNQVTGRVEDTLGAIYTPAECTQFIADGQQWLINSRLFSGHTVSNLGLFAVDEDTVCGIQPVPPDANVESK